LLDSLLQEIEVHFSSTMESCAKCFMCQTELVEKEFEIHIREYHRIVTDVDLIIKLQLQCETRKSLVLSPPESPILTSTEVEAIKTPPKGIVTPADVYEAFGMPVSPEYTISACIESTPVCDKVKSRVSSVIKPEISEMVPTPTSLVEDILEGKSLTVEELVPKEAQAEVKLRSKSSNIDQRARRGSNETSKTRKRKSLVICQNVNAVSNKIQFWKGKENVSKSVESKIYSSGNPVTALIPKREKKSETFVNELLKQTLVEHLKGQKSADDTILVFDEIFAKNCPSIMDEAVEDNFNLLLDEPFDSAKVNTEDQCSEIVQSTHLNDDLPEEPSYEDVIGGNDADDHGGSTNLSSIANDEEGIAKIKPDQIVNEILADEEIVGNVANSDYGEIPYDIEKLDESNPDQNLSNFGTPTEKVDGKYRCSSCSKDFKFLTYLKAHQNSKSGCVSSAGKRRPSMNFSKIHYNDH